ncbi:hypothetical protein AB835_13130 [Candidatus Endobugula sertula]|uniref:Cobalt transporter n=1 Tax=Candidatus Endobugula sertula TaxID=62101 RepID=A0A1D2QM16_9GAMM|nr:hypothetical protein AB835_13130 [Candidatus Endobugula sertula]
MIFRRIIYTTLFVGLLAGLLMSVVQIFTVNPIIFAAEAFEVHDHGSHVHGEEAWAPADGSERTFYTVFSNISAGIGFSAILLALMSQLQTSGMTRLTIPKGALWGLAGFIVAFVAPGIGMPPEIPGIQAAPLESRQLWWLLAVVGTALGIFVLAFVRIKYKAWGVVAIALPFFIGAPQHDGPAFTHPDPVVVASLTQLHEQFMVVTSLSNLLFWLVMGVVSAWALNRWVLRQASVSLTHT